MVIVLCQLCYSRVQYSVVNNDVYYNKLWVSLVHVHQVQQAIVYYTYSYYMCTAAYAAQYSIVFYSIQYSIAYQYKHHYIHIMDTYRVYLQCTVVQYSVGGIVQCGAVYYVKYSGVQSSISCFEYLVLYGALYVIRKHVCYILTKCHILFLIYYEQNILEYIEDDRIDQADDRIDQAYIDLCVCVCI